MASKTKDEKNEIKSFFKTEVEEMSKDENLRRNNIMNSLVEKHGNAMTAHSDEYTRLLEEYINNSKKTSQQKKRFKEVFFWVAILTLFFSFLLFAGISVYFSLQDFSKINIEDLTGLISSLVGLLSLYIIIPKIIAKYLFNVKEDKNMAKIVKSVQKYDAKVFVNISSDNTVPKNKSKNDGDGDEIFMSD